MTPAELRALADEAEKQAAELEFQAERQARTLKDQAKTLRLQAITLRKLAEDAERPTHKQLHTREQKSRVNRQMEAVHRVAISEGRSGKDPFLRAIRKAHYTLRSLAEAVGVKAPTLSAHRRPKSDENSRPIPAERAGKVELLTGWPADAAHWPAGITS